MNKFAWTKTKDSNGPQKVEITLSPAVHDLLMDVLKEWYLIPILQGERRELPDGMIYYCFYLPDQDAERIKEAFFKAYWRHTGHITEN
jgi:hypothetical protein